MQIVIDIQEDHYYDILQYAELKVNTEFENLMIAAIKNGAPLPKGHGQLKDVDKIGLTGFECLLCNGDYKEALKMLDKKIKNAPTIIEADMKGGKE